MPRLYTPESELEVMLINQVKDIKHRYSVWTNPYDLARELEIPVIFAKIGPEQEGAALADKIILDPNTEIKARQRFTFYHEIVHHLVRRNDVLYSILDDQYRSNEDLTRIIERLCNVGAAEFIIPRATVLAAIEASGFSLSLIRDLSRTNEVSSTAVFVQLLLSAKHQCIGIVCRMVDLPNTEAPSLFGPGKPTKALQVETAVSSIQTHYKVARGSLIFKEDFLYEVSETECSEVTHDKAPIPFRNNRTWKVDCEAMCIGKQVFGIFHIDSPPMKNPYQLHLF